ncbi:unnamed protein product [Albugo candida]|uniref:Uncharacterized protein n=1 Tax=Albugo candida TaxID=65357 RepID=A0A024G8E2_9STRA|nr:unnamed protein product [Albugo candida]|eukprot:CCI43146.1 unnamed protein product [Albugo candida]
MKTPFSQMCLLPVFCSSIFGKHIKIARNAPYPTLGVAVIKGYKDLTIPNAIWFEVKPDRSKKKEEEQLNPGWEKFYISGYLNQELDQHLEHKWTPFTLQLETPTPDISGFKMSFLSGYKSDIEVVFSIKVIAAVLRNHMKETLCLKWINVDDIALFLSDDDVENTKEKPVHYHKNNVGKEPSTTKLDDVLGPIQATVKFWDKFLPGQNVRFDYAVVASIVPKKVYDKSMRCLSQTPEEDRSYKCKHLRCMPSIEFTFNGNDEETYIFLATDYIVQVPGHPGSCFISLTYDEAMPQNQWTIGILFARNHPTRYKISEEKSGGKILQFGFAKTQDTTKKKK